MKYLIRLLLLAVVGVTACCFVVRNWRSAKPPGASTGSVAKSADVDVVPSPISNPLASLKASLRVKLQQWRESEIQDPDNEEGRAQLMNDMSAMLTDENVAEIVQSLSPEEMKTDFAAVALGRWMKVDPAAASNWLAAQPNATQEQTTAVAEGWVGNHDSLAQYLDQLPDNAWKQNLIETVGAQTTVRNPRLSVEMAMQMKPGEARTNLFKAIACAWMNADPPAAVNWIAGVKDPNLSDQLIASAAQAYALTDPAQAATWLVSDVKSEAVVETAALNIISSWLIKDPQGAADWVAQFPDGQIKARAIAKVTTRWRLTDPAAANAWLQQLFNGT